MDTKYVIAPIIECARRGRQFGDPSGETALALPLGELAARTG